MQRQGGGSCPCSGGLLKGGSSQRGGSCPCTGGLLQAGGGNNPSCGCDMQAGWPSTSELPRGGIQGGGNWNFNEFNLALTKNGRTRHLRGKWNKNKTSTRSSYNGIVTRKKRKTRRVTSAPSSVKKTRSTPKIKSFTTKTSPKTYSIISKSSNYTPRTPYFPSTPNTRNMSPVPNNFVPQTPPYLNKTPRNNNTTNLEGGRHKGKKHGKGCPCFMCMFKKMKV